MDQLARAAPSAVDRQNNFGLLRLVFASLVVVSHATELIDGDGSREILRRIFGTLSLGDVAVDGFFLVSGYLVTASYQRHPVGTFLLNRVLRIYPGYIAAFLICLVAIAPLAGAGMDGVDGQPLLSALARIPLLGEPVLPGSFAGLPHPSLNGAMWTLVYEFRCYLLALLFGLLGLDQGRRRYLYLAIVVGCLAISAHGEELPFYVPKPVVATFGWPPDSARLFAAFGTGAVFYVFRDRIVYRRDVAIACAAIALSLAFVPLLAEAGLVTFGGYVVLWFAFGMRTTALSSATTRTDISYGLYLYAWPIENLLVWHHLATTPPVVGLLTLGLAAGAGLASWKLIEGPALRLRRRSEPELRPRQS